MKITKIQKIFLIIIMFVSVAFIIPEVSLAGEQELNNLEFNIELTDSGSMIVEEIWDVYIYETNTLFKTFPYDNNYDAISDVSVKEIFNDGSVKPFNKRDVYAYHVDEDCYHALNNEDGMFEIAWGVNEEYGSVTRKFSIMYTIENCVKIYNDTAELYWQLIGDDFEIPSNNIKGTIKLPEAVENLEELRVWAHGPLDGTIQKVDESTVEFELPYLSSYEFLEIRIATPINLFLNSINVYNENKLDNIIAEETAWAEEANLRRERELKIKKGLRNLCDLMEVICIIYFGNKFINNKKKVSERPKIVPAQKFKYFRDIPDEKASPLEVAFEYFYTKNGTYGNFGNSLSATFMQLALKRWIEFEVIQGNKKEEIQVRVTDAGKEDLTQDEKIVYDWLVEVAHSKVEKEFTMKEFEKYCIKNNTKFSKMIEKLTEVVKDIAVKKGKFDKKQQKMREQIGISIAGYFFLAFALIACAAAIEANVVLSILAVLIVIANFCVLIILDSRYTGVTQKTVDEAEMWNGLKKYMEDFSLIKDREVPELVLWEKYLVFATTFGVAEKVIKQLKVVYPELNDPDSLSSSYAYMHIACNSNSNFNFVHSMNSAMNTATTYSSGSGAGGGFSGGGGGGRRWRWRRRSLISKFEINNKKEEFYILSVKFFFYT